MRAVKMINKSTFLLVCAGGVILNGSVLAAAESSCDKKLHISYANGIMNSFSDRVAGQMALKAMIGPTYNGLPVEYGLSENPSDGLLKDLARVLKQKIAEDPSLTWDLLARYVLKLDPAGLSPIVKRNLDEIIAKIKNEKTADLKQRFEAENNYIDKSVERHVANYKNLIVEQGKSVLIVGHSQGNLYANAGHKKFYAQTRLRNQSLGVVGVATPANYVAGGGQYLTSSTDLVISLLRLFVSESTLPGNIDLPFSLREPEGHSFTEVYVDTDSKAYQPIQQMTKNGLKRLSHPNKAGAILANYEAVSWRMTGGGMCTSRTGDGIWPVGWVSWARSYYLGKPYTPMQSYEFVDGDERAIPLEKLAPYLPPDQSEWLARLNGGQYDQTLRWYGPGAMFRAGYCQVSEGPPDYSRFSFLDYFTSPDTAAMAAAGMTLSRLPVTSSRVTIRADVCSKRAITQ
ncbi:hypothetical protein [Paraburkholderia bonniea]|uniref:hypothetical protein n=1 Tax=Paraburkholderia bonniea TaxID=2152891 RepID=UPI001291E4F9|nr:hypothetical protein [Paraburkholderia bonniea]